MEWRGVTTTNVYIANFFFLAAFGLFISAQWELTGGNGFGYSVFSAFGKFVQDRETIRHAGFDESSNTI